MGLSMTSTTDSSLPWLPPVVGGSGQEPSFPPSDPYNEDPYYPDPYTKM